MRFNLSHIVGSAFNTPLLMQRGRLDTILTALGPRILDGAEIRPGPDGQPLRAERPERLALSGSGRRRYAGGGYLAEEGIAVLPIVGTMLRRGSWLDAECGLMSYGLIRQSFDEMIADPSVRGVMLELDTPGGEAGGCFDLCRHMRDASDALGKPIWAHANELAASAGYALASVATKGGLWVATTAEVGSIGVLAAHIDMSRADERAGLRWTYIFGGDHKVDGNIHEPLSDSARATIEADVADLYGMFVDLVASNRGISAQAVRATKADMFRGTKSVASKLSDKVGTFHDAMQAFALSLGESDMAPARRMASPSSQRTSASAVVDVERHRCGAIAQAARQAKEFGVDVDAGGLITRGVAAEPALAEIKRVVQVAGIAKLAERAGAPLPPDHLLSGNLSAHQAGRDALNMRAARDEATGEISTFSPGKARPSSSRDVWRRVMKGADR